VTAKVLAQNVNAIQKCLDIEKKAHDTLVKDGWNLRPLTALNA
jgi:hypothetical protein